MVKNIEKLRLETKSHLLDELKLALEGDIRLIVPEITLPDQQAVPAAEGMSALEGPRNAITPIEMVDIPAPNPDRVWRN